MRKAQIAMLIAGMSLGVTAATAQQRQDGETSVQGKQDRQSQQQRGGLNQQVRAFYKDMEQTMRQAVRNQNPGQAAEFLRQHLSENAMFTTTNTLSINGRQVATAVVTLDDDSLSDLLGFAANAMHSGARRNIQGYRLEIDVQNIQAAGDGAARVSTVLRESGQIGSGQDGVASGQGRQQMRQQEGSGSSPRTQRTRDQQSALDDQDGQDSRGTIGRGLGSGTKQFQVTARCEQLLRLGNDGQIKIDNTSCRANTEIES